MNVSFDDPSKLRKDEDWLLQGRIIPPSCTNGDGAILHIQAKKTSWENDHFHVCRLPITAEAGLEFAISLLNPPLDELLRDSYDEDEREADLDYLQMVKLGDPPDSIAFLTVSQLTIVIKNEALAQLIFSPLELCGYCGDDETTMLLPVLGALSADLDKFDSLMSMDINGKNH